METLFIVLAFIGTFSCGFFACMTIVFAFVMNQQDKKSKYRKPAEGGKENADQNRSIK